MFFFLFYIGVKNPKVWLDWEGGFPKPLNWISISAKNNMKHTFTPLIKIPVYEYPNHKILMKTPAKPLTLHQSSEITLSRRAEQASHHTSLCIMLMCLTPFPVIWLRLRESNGGVVGDWSNQWWRSNSSRGNNYLWD